MDKKLFSGDVRHQIVHVSLSPPRYEDAAHSDSLRIVYFDDNYILRVAYPQYADGRDITYFPYQKDNKIRPELQTRRYYILKSDDLMPYDENMVWTTAEELCLKHIEEIYTSISPRININTRRILCDGQEYETLVIPQAADINFVIFRRIIQRFASGTHIKVIEEEYAYYLENGKEAYLRKYIRNIPDGADEKVTRFVSKSTGYDIRFERETGNTNLKTFDFIRVRIPIPTRQARPDRKEYIVKNSNEFINYALLQIKKNRHFQNFGIPIEYLKLSRITITGSSELEFLFELKRI